MNTAEMIEIKTKQLTEWGEAMGQQQNMKFVIEGIMQQNTTIHRWMVYERVKMLIEAMVLDDWREHSTLTELTSALIGCVCGDEGYKDPKGNFTGRDRVDDIANRWMVVNVQCKKQERAAAMTDECEF